MTSASETPVEAAARIVALADQCVKCGLCLPHCPSYRVRAEEGESPRGRIAYAKAIALGAEPGGAMRAHLDGCLACGACEVVCPSRVSYIELIAATRARGTRTARAASIARRARALARSRLAWRVLRRLRFAASLASRLFARSGLGAAAAALRGLPDPARAPRDTPAAGAARGDIALFRGCIASVVDADTHAAAARVLARLGWNVRVPDEAHCCGALAHHAGALGEAEHDAAQASRVFAATGAGRIATCATGCAWRVRDIVAPAAGAATADEALVLLARDPAFAALPLKTLARRALLMWPCTQPQAGGEAAVREVLARIPGLALVLLPQQPRCCGAAGTYFLEQPATAAALRDERLDQIEALAPDIVLTTNVGCRIYLQAGLRARGRAIPVAHPLALIDEALSP